MSQTNQTIVLSVDERFLLLLLMDHHSCTPREQVKLFKLIELLEFSDSERERINLRFDEGIKCEVYDTNKNFENEYIFTGEHVTLMQKIYNESALQLKPTKTIRSVINKFNLMEDQEDATQKA